MKNRIYTARMEGYTAQGLGVCRIGGRAVFVSGALDGELWEVRIVRVTSGAVWGRGEKLLEPVMKVEAIVPDQYLGDVVGDINARRGRIESIETRVGEQSVHCFVPLSEMFGYATDLRSRSQGRGTFTMQFAQYEAVPKNVATKILGTVNYYNF